MSILVAPIRRFKQSLQMPVIFLLFLVTCHLSAQPLQRKALFLGNSYTYVNNLPWLIAAMAHASGDSLFFDSNTPGGYTLGWQPIAHSSDPVSLAKIREHSWDFVVLQEQSQTPAIARLRDSCMLPASMVLFDSIKAADPCSRALFYLTWGRRFGGIQCFSPGYCSAAFAGFDQMQDSLTVAYKMVADSLVSPIAPVGEAWRLALKIPGMVLHDVDDSHPNLKGSYLAACVFYAAMFDKHALGNLFTAGLTVDTANMLQLVADSVTFGFAALWNLNLGMPKAGFTTSTSTDTLFTHNHSDGSGNWYWDFGDGQSSTVFEPVHVYTAAGTYPVRLKACNDCFCDSVSHPVVIETVGICAGSRETKAIKLIGPGVGGNIRFLNFSGDGIFSLYAATGANAGNFAVWSGTAIIPVKPGIWFWKLTDRRLTVVARGKIAM